MGARGVEAALMPQGVADIGFLFFPPMLNLALWLKTEALGELLT